jgi:3-deoxy-manno-octulosonate cytidylyltransferase (CMP-KDO synthetase)
MINGKTMIRRVYEQAVKCRELHRVVVATDHEAIYNHVRSFHGAVVMTSTSHRSGTERCLEALEAGSGSDSFQYIVNIQGDEPFINPAQISVLANCLTSCRAGLATLIKTIRSAEELTNPNVVKVVISATGEALYFSRAAIPFLRGQDISVWPETTVYYKHIGIYGYSAEALRKIVALPETVAEKAESLEQLRWLEHGFHIMTEKTEYESIAIDTPEDVLKIPVNLV